MVTHPLQTCDIFHTKDDGGGRIVIFIHGGYWRSLDKSEFSHVARGLQLHGLTVAMPNYRLCPEVALAEIHRRHREIRHLAQAAHRSADCGQRTFRRRTPRGMPRRDRLGRPGVCRGYRRQRPRCQAASTICGRLLPTEVNRSTLALDEAAHVP